jgi:proteic killer suppression protein
VIRSFKNREAEAIFNGQHDRHLPQDVFDRARNKLAMLNAAAALTVFSAPGNRLKRLAGGDLWSVRINDQWRLVFRFENGDAYDVWFGDYH